MDSQVNQWHCPWTQEKGLKTKKTDSDILNCPIAVISGPFQGSNAEIRQISNSNLQKMGNFSHFQVMAP